MLASMTWNQLKGWMEYASIEPFGEERDDYRSGIVASVIANVNRDSKTRPEPYSPLDFMPIIKAALSNTPAAKSRRRPITDPAEWRKVKRMAAVYAAGGKP